MKGNPSRDCSFLRFAVAISSTIYRAYPTAIPAAAASVIATQQGWAYLSIIKDLFDGFIVAHRCGRENSLGLVFNTPKQAKKKEKITEGMILHSDRGYQYASQQYFVLTQEYSLIPSMSRRGNCCDNAPIENFFGHLREEALRQVRRSTFEEAQQIIDDYVHFYNYEWIQLKTRQTPFETRCLST